MKNKFLKLAAVVLCLVFITGCGSKNQLKCTAEAEQNGKKYHGEVIAELDDNDKVKDVSMEMTFDSSEEADQTYSMFQLVIGMAKSMAQEGQEVPNIDIQKNGKTITISNYAAFATFSSDEDETPLIGMTKDEFIKKVSEENSNGEKWTCK